MTTDSDITVYLSFHHPRRRAEEVTAALRIDPELCRDRGVARNTPYGGALAGRHPETYWITELPIFDDMGLAKAVTEQLDRLEPQRDFTRAWADGGGRVELEIYWKVTRVFHTELPHTLLQRLAEFGMGIELHPMGAQ